MNNYQEGKTPSALYAPTKIFYFQEKLKAVKEGNITAPIHIRLKPTNRCNHRCYYCCYRSDSLYLSELMNENDEIPREKMKEIVRDLGQMGVKAVTFSGGGEPLCYPYFNEAVGGLLNAGIKVAVLTNGSLLNGRVAEILGKGAAWVRISMDAADAQTYAKTRGVSPREFNRVCDNIYNFAKMKSENCELGINFIVTKDNHRDVFKFLELMKKLGTDHVKVCECIVSTKGEENKRYHVPFSDSVKKQIAAGFSDLVNNNFAVIDKFSDFDDKFNKYEKQYSWCPLIQCLTVIAADMNVYACHDKAYTKRGKLGSIKGKSFQELWFSKKTKDRLSGLNPNKECDHHCADHAKNLMLLNYMEVYRGHLEFV